MNEAREKLHVEIVRLNEARAVTQKVTEALARAKEIAAHAEEEASQFAGLDAEIASHHARQLKSAVAMGSPMTSLAELPAGLREQKRERDAAVEKVTIAKAVVAALEADREASASEEERRIFEVDAAIEAVLVGEAEERARNFVVRLDELRREYDALCALGQCPMRLAPHEPKGAFGASTRLMHHAKIVFEAANQHSLVRYGELATNKAEKEVHAYFDRLRSDAGARLE